MNIIAWLILGIIIGLIGHSLEPKSNGSLLGAVLLGSLGAVVGGIFASLVFETPSFEGFSLITFSLVTLGSLLLIVSSKALRGVIR